MTKLQLYLEFVRTTYKVEVNFRSNCDSKLYLTKVERKQKLLVIILRKFWCLAYHPPTHPPSHYNWRTKGIRAVQRLFSGKLRKQKLLVIILRKFWCPLGVPPTHPPTTTGISRVIWQFRGFSEASWENKSCQSSS